MMLNRIKGYREVEIVIKGKPHPQIKCGCGFPCTMCSLYCKIIYDMQKSNRKREVQIWRNYLRSLPTSIHR